MSPPHPPAIDIPEISLNQLLTHSPADLHEHIRLTWADPRVHFLVLFRNEEDTEHKLVTIGPMLDYTRLDRVLKLEIEGMRATAYVCSCHHAQALRENMAQTAPEEGDHNVQLALGIDAFNPEDIERIVSDDLLNKRDELRGFREKLLNLREELIARETYIAESEEKLSQRAQFLLEQEAELKQFEEELYERERRIKRMLFEERSVQQAG